MNLVNSQGKILFISYGAVETNRIEFYTPRLSLVETFINLRRITDCMK